ncbi:MAG: O-antigen ligase family protein [Desulfobacteraceae bacterium]|nr:O-antigen ligase family protein [Desulfobacteraceae bacterium]
MVLEAVSPVRFGVLEESAELLGKDAGAEAFAYLWSNALAWWVFLVGVLLFARVFWGYAARSRNLIIIAGVMMEVALFEAQYGLVQALIPTLGVLWADTGAYLGDARGTYINRNHFAGLIEMVWPVGLGLVLALGRIWGGDVYAGGGYRRRLKNFLASDKVGVQLFLWAVPVFMLLWLLFSKSRAGITGAFIGFVSFVVLTHAGGRRFSWPAWAAMLAGLGFLLFYGNVIGFEEIVGRFLMIDAHAGSRVDIWRDTLVMIGDHPAGVGLRNYEAVMPVYNAHGPLGIKFTHAHNYYLQILAEAGWPGFLFIVGGFFVFWGCVSEGYGSTGLRWMRCGFLSGLGLVQG